MNKCVLVVVLAVTSNVAAAPTTSIYLGGGRPTDPRTTGEETSLLAGAAVGFPLHHSWMPRIAVDLRRIVGPTVDVDIDDLRVARKPRALAVRALAGLRLRGERARLTWFGQLAAGVQWERATSNRFFRPNASSPYEPRGEKTFSSVGLVIEPAIGAALHFGRLEIGAQLALAYSTEETVMPTSVNEDPTSPTNVLATAFAEHRW